MNFNHYFTNDELAEILSGWVGEYPALAALSTLGHSYEGRPIPLLTLTNQASGPDTDKPAIWIDANIHASELASTTTALHIAHTLLTSYGTDARATRLLDTSAVYLAPRLNPDGAALALAPAPKIVRSGTRPYPFAEKDDGIHAEDMDGDGRVLQMRIPDPSGDWKVSSLDPKLMEKRGPDEQEGQFYRLFEEGRIENFDGVQIRPARPLQGLDFNRNFPFEWQTESDQLGAGPYPTSEVEIRAVVDFITRHPNINIAITYHTFSGVILRPFSTRPDDKMDVNDLWVYELMGERGKEITGYKCVSVYHGFRYHPNEVTTGAFDDWAYDHLGIFAFTVELWDLPGRAGIEDRDFIQWFRKHPHAEDVKVLRWLEANAPADALVDWYTYDHPQLGPVELGGVDRLYTWRNPPHAFMGEEAAKNTPYALALADMLPRLALRELATTALGDGRYRLRLAVENSGFLATNTSGQGQKRKAARPVRVELGLPAGASLITGKARTELGHLQGRSNKLDMLGVYGESPTDNRAWTEWVVQGQPGDKIRVDILSDRAGNVRTTVAL